MLYIPVALQCLSLLRQRACWGIPESTKTILLASTALRTGFVSGSVPESLKPMKSPNPSVGENGPSALCRNGRLDSWTWSLRLLGMAREQKNLDRDSKTNSGRQIVSSGPAD